MALFAYAATVLAWNVLVILWGAYVRATGSGAGCGAHWPLCNGEVLPRTPVAETLIELTHRATSGVALLLVLGLVVWVLRTRPHGDRARFWAGLSCLFIVSEALLGAGLVLFELVADDASGARAFAMAAHLANTFALLAALALTARWCARPVVAAAVAAAGGAPLADVKPAGGTRQPLLLLALAGLVAVAVTGAIAALGNTLFPAGSVAEGLAADFSPGSHFLLRLRVLHPFLGIGVGLFVAAAAAATAWRSGERRVLLLASVVVSLFVLQTFCGVANWLLLAPVWLQLLHLLLADALWIALVLLTSVAGEAHAGVAPLEETAPARVALAGRQR